MSRSSAAGKFVLPGKYIVLGLFRFFYKNINNWILLLYPNYRGFPASSLIPYVYGNNGIMPLSLPGQREIQGITIVPNCAACSIL
jgi:hypothetical protein